MNTKVLFFLMLFIVLSCKEEKTTNHNDNTANEDPKEITLEASKVIDESFLKMRSSDSIVYANVQLQDNGMLFSDDTKTPHYIKIPFSNLDLSMPFNVSFSYSTSSNEGSKPQTFVAFVNQYSSPSKCPLYLYTAANRITGVYGNQILWAQNYNIKEGESKAYYDSYRLNSEEFYFVSVNFTGSELKIYVNSELYASFSNIEPHDLKFNSIYVGAFPEGDAFNIPFKGVIHGLKIFSKALNEKEIVSVYNSQPYLEPSN